ncbi:MAG: FecR domain-containing protein [Elusimicrobia bacterium]|nr:FecR domain-containing protein [Elusimicrobiota bacterium]
MKSIPARVEASQRVRTGSVSWATLSFADRTRIEMGENSYVTLASADETGTELTLGLGAIHAWVEKLVTRKRFIVHTPAVDMAVRGTEFTVEVKDTKEVQVDVLSGVLGVKTLLGEELEIGDDRPLRSLRVFPDRPLDLPRPEPGKGPEKKEDKKQGAAEPAMPGSDVLAEFKKDVEREVGLGLSKDAVQAVAAEEARRAEYQEGKTMIDVFGARVRIEEYIVRPAADQFKFVVLNERSDRYDYFYYQAQFNQALPESLSPALRYLNGKTGTAPDYFITAFETGRSNTQDTVQEIGTGGHLVNAALAADQTVYDPDANSFRTVSAGTGLWQTLFNDYTYKINGAEKFGWQPNIAGTDITAYDYVATGFNTRILGAPCVNQACEDAARPNSITQPDGASYLHDRVTINYAGDGTTETYDFYVVGDDGKIATTADFNGVTTGDAYKNTLLKFNYQQTITATEFNGRKIDLVVEPKILVKSGVIQ